MGVAVPWKAHPAIHSTHWHARYHGDAAQHRLPLYGIRLTAVSLASQVKDRYFSRLLNDSAKATGLERACVFIMIAAHFLEPVAGLLLEMFISIPGRQWRPNQLYNLKIIKQCFQGSVCNIQSIDSAANHYAV